MMYRNLPKAISLALMLAAASLGPLMLPGTALAEAPKEGASGDQPSAKSDAAPAKPAKTKAKSKVKKAASAKAHAKADKTRAKGDKSASKPKAKRTAAREAKPSTKRAKAPAKTDGDSPKHGAARSPCTGAAVALDRGGVESDRFALVDCHGRPLASAIAKVSVLARPWGAPKKPVAKASRLNGGVIARLETIAKKFAGRTISLVGSSSAQASGGGAHQAGRAIDLRVDGVDNRKLVELCRTLPDTGCGYYPNASFVHVDARAAGAGKSYWIDASEPGEPPRYVTSWPPDAAAK